jgi:2-C-methyl-D-erythritol 2,4-cyclodiphosphate synthase
MFRIGFGYDVHQLTEGRTFKLGGIVIPHYKGPLGHSDSDVLIHSICDALLGAANLRDIGFHFPDTSAEFKDIDSRVLLKKVVDLLHENNYSITNIDSTVCLQQPKIKDFIPLMQEALAETMNIAIDQISVKATTTEKLGFVGREDGVAAYAVVLISKNQ